MLWHSGSGASGQSMKVPFYQVYGLFQVKVKWDDGTNDLAKGLACSFQPSRVSFLTSSFAHDLIYHVRSRSWLFHTSVQSFGGMNCSAAFFETLHPSHTGMGMLIYYKQLDSMPALTSRMTQISTLQAPLPLIASRMTQPNAHHNLRCRFRGPLPPSSWGTSSRLATCMWWARCHALARCSSSSTEGDAGFLAHAGCGYSEQSISAKPLHSAGRASACSQGTLALAHGPHTRRQSTPEEGVCRPASC